jgi:hypothetical protein
MPGTSPVQVQGTVTIATHFLHESELDLGSTGHLLLAGGGRQDRLRAVRRSMFGQEMAGQERYVLGTLAEGRQLNAKDAQTIKQIGPKGAGLHQWLERSVGWRLKREQCEFTRPGTRPLRGGPQPSTTVRREARAGSVGNGCWFG